MIFLEVTIPAGAPADYALRFTTFWYATDARDRRPPQVLRVPIAVRQK